MNMAIDNEPGSDRKPRRVAYGTHGQTMFYDLRESLIGEAIDYCRNHPETWPDRLADWVGSRELYPGDVLTQAQLGEYLNECWLEHIEAIEADPDYDEYDVPFPVNWTPQRISNIEKPNKRVCDFSIFRVFENAEFPVQPNGEPPDSAFWERMLFRQRTPETVRQLKAQYAKHFRDEVPVSKALVIVLECLKNEGFESIQDFLVKRSDRLDGNTINALKCLERGDEIGREHPGRREYETGITVVLATVGAPHRISEVLAAL